jgi:hypothetical protein
MELYWQGKIEELGEKPLPVSLSTNPTRTEPVANQCLRGARPANNRLNMAQSQRYVTTTLGKTSINDRKSK